MSMLYDKKKFITIDLNRNNNGTKSTKKNLKINQPKPRDPIKLSEKLTETLNKNEKVIETIRSSNLKKIYNKIASPELKTEFFPEGNFNAHTKRKWKMEEKKEKLSKSSSKIKKDTILKNETINPPMTIEAAKNVIKEAFRIPSTHELCRPVQQLIKENVHFERGKIKIDSSARSNLNTNKMKREALNVNKKNQKNAENKTTKVSSGFQKSYVPFVKQSLQELDNSNYTHSPKIEENEPNNSEEITIDTAKLDEQSLSIASDQFFDCCDLFPKLKTNLVNIDFSELNTECNIENFLESKITASQMLSHFRELFGFCTNNKRETIDNFLVDTDIDLLKRILEADDEYHQLKKEDHDLLKEILLSQLKQIEKQENIVDNVLKSVRKGKTQHLDDLSTSSVRTQLEQISETVLEKSATDIYFETSEKNCSKSFVIPTEVNTDSTDDSLIEFIPPKVSIVLKKHETDNAEKKNEKLKEDAGEKNEITALVNNNIESNNKSNNEESNDLQQEKISKDLLEQNKDIQISDKISIELKPFEVCNENRLDLDKTEYILSNVLYSLNDLPQKLVMDELHSITEERIGDSMKIFESAIPPPNTPTKQKINIKQFANETNKNDVDLVSGKNNDLYLNENFSENECMDQNNESLDWSHIPITFTIPDHIAEKKLDEVESSIFFKIDWTTGQMVLNTKNENDDKSIDEGEEEDCSSFAEISNEIIPEERIMEIINKDDQNNSNSKVSNFVEIENYLHHESMSLSKIDSLNVNQIFHKANKYRIQKVSLVNLRNIEEFYIPNRNDSFELKKTNYFELISNPDELFHLLKPVSPFLIDEFIKSGYVKEIPDKFLESCYIKEKIFNIYENCLTNNVGEEPSTLLQTKSEEEIFQLSKKLKKNFRIKKTFGKSLKKRNTSNNKTRSNDKTQKQSKNKTKHPYILAFQCFLFVIMVWCLLNPYPICLEMIRSLS